MKQIKKEIKKLYLLYSKLVKQWNGEFKNGDDADFPITIIIEVLLQNMAFDESDCHSYNEKEDIAKLYSSFETLKELNEYNDKGYMTHFAFTEVDYIFSHNIRVEDMTDLQNENDLNGLENESPEC